MDQLTSSQQAHPNHVPSQGLYASLLMRAHVGVHSLSARSFKVLHRKRRLTAERGGKFYLIPQSKSAKVHELQSKSNSGMYVRVRQG